MKRELSTYTTLVISIAVVWLAFAALIGWGIVSSTKRVNDRGEAALNRLIGDQRERMGLALQHIEQDLREEAAFVAAHDSLSDAMLRIRWTPMLQSNWVLTAVALANEAGEEQWVERIGDNRPALDRQDCLWPGIAHACGQIAEGIAAFGLPGCHIRHA